MPAPGWEIPGAFVGGACRGRGLEKGGTPFKAAIFSPLTEIGCNPEISSYRLEVGNGSWTGCEGKLSLPLDAKARARRFCAATFQTKCYYFVLEALLGVGVGAVIFHFKCQKWLRPSSLLSQAQKPMFYHLPTFICKERKGREKATISPTAVRHIPSRPSLSCLARMVLETRPWQARWPLGLSSSAAMSCSPSGA